jgi:hypothetical protein
VLPAKRAALEGSVAVDDDVCRALGGLRITADARIVPIWMSQGLIAPEPWSPWLERGEMAAPRHPASREARQLALAG